MNIPVYEHHDGIAYDAFIKTTAADIVPTRAGIVGRVTRVTLRKVTTARPYYRRNIPANMATLTAEQQRAIIEQPELFRGQLWPLWQLDTRAYKWAEKLNLTKGDK